MNNKTLVIFLLFAGFVATNSNAQVNKAIDCFINDTSFTHASISVCIRDGSSGEVVYSYNMNSAMGSASVMKLVTTAAAIEILGPDYRFRTLVGYAGTLERSTGILNGYVIIRGGGDPTLGSEYINSDFKTIVKSWSDALIDAGINEISGRVLADASLYDYYPAAEGWNWSDLGNYYGSGVHGLTLADNMYRIYLQTGAEGSKPEITMMEPEIPNLLIDNQLITYGNRDRGYIYVEPYGNLGFIRGSIPTERDDFILKASIPDPPYFAADALHNELTSKGISIKNPPATMRTFHKQIPDSIINNVTICNQTVSPPLREIISATNKNSLNHYAEHLLRQLAVEQDNSGPADIATGIKSIEDYLKSVGIGNEGLYQTDGSGLSRSNAISSGFTTSLLFYMKSISSNSEYFLASLPRAGEDGTLEHCFRDPLFSGRLTAKSGTSTRIRNYAGYFTDLKGRDRIFAVLVNNFDCTPAEVTNRVEQLLKSIITEEQTKN